MTHIYGLSCVSLSALAGGSTIVTMPRFEPAAFLDVLSRHKVSYASLVPPLVNFLVRGDEWWRGSCNCCVVGDVCVHVG